MSAGPVRGPAALSRVERLYAAYAWACAGFLLLSIGLSLLHSEAGAFRNWQIGLNALLFLSLLGERAFQRAAPIRLPGRAVRALALAALAWVSAYQLCRFYAFGVNGVDFSIFDWMLYDTNHGRFMYSPIYGVDHLGIHPSYILLPLVPLHRLFQTPLLLLSVAALALWAGLFPLWRLGRRLGQDDGRCLLLGGAYLTCPWSGLVLDGGFRPEIFVPALGLAFAVGWLEERPAWWGPALVGLLCVKEDVALYMGAFAVGALLLRPGRRKAALGILGVSAALFLANTAWLQPLFLEGSGYARPVYLTFWKQYGDSLPTILKNMLLSPAQVLGELLTSGWYKMFAPALFLPLLGGLPLFPMLPALFVMGTSSNTLRDYHGYAPVMLLPFFLWGMLEAWHTLGRVPALARHRDLILATALLLFPLVGGGYLKFGLPAVDELRALPAVRARLAGAGGPLCVQPILFPHLPYGLDLRMLTDDCLRQPEAMAVVHPGLDPYPYTRPVLERLVEHAMREGRAERLPSRFALVRGPARL